MQSHKRAEPGLRVNSTIRKLGIIFKNILLQNIEEVISIDKKNNYFQKESGET